MQKLTGASYNIFLGKTFEPLFDWLLQERELRDFYCFQEFPENKLHDLKQYMTTAKAKQNYDMVFAPGFSWRGITLRSNTVTNSSFRYLMCTLAQTFTIGVSCDKLRN